MSNMRGLTVFISDIRDCNSKEAELSRVELELANIRGRFTGSKPLSSYHKKKYAWKMIYIYMLGYEIDFGHMEVINLITAPKFSEKRVGYVGISLLLKNTDDVMTLIVNSIRNDIVCDNDAIQSLALACVANIGGDELTVTLANDIMRLLLATTTQAPVRKKAALCLLRMFRTDPDIIEGQDWVPRLINLLQDKNLGVITSVMSLLLGLVSMDPTGFEDAVQPVVMLLTRLVMHKACTPDYLYYATPSPWLQVKLLRLLQYVPQPAVGSELGGRLNEVLRRILTKTDVTKSVNKNNADHSILFEAVSVVIAQAECGDAELRNTCVTLLGRFISVREPNIRYLGLAHMTRLAAVEGTKKLIRSHQNTILYSLKDSDISIRKQALGLLFAMCDSSNAMSIVGELLSYLVVADFAMKEEMVLKIAILAERFATDLQWYVDTCLQLITICGEHVSDDIWHRCVQIITNNEDLQPYAARRMYGALQPEHVQETLVRVGGYVLGEFGDLLAEREEGEVGGEEEGEIITGAQQFDTLQRHYGRVGPATRALLLSTYVKMVNTYDELRDDILDVFDDNANASSAELQQRAVEYRCLPDMEETMAAVLEPMPPFPEGRESGLLRRLQSKSDAAQDRPPEELEAAAAAAAGGKHDEDSYSSGEEEEGDPKGEQYSGSSGEEDEGQGGAVGAAAAEEPQLLDLLAADPPPAPAAAAGTQPPAVPGGGATTVGVEPEVAAQMRGWFKAACVSPKAVLYQDARVQLGIQQAAQGAQARVSLFLGNKSGAPLTAVSLTLPPVPYLKVQTKPMGSELAAGAQAQQQHAIACLQPFADAPKLQLSYTCGGVTHNIGLRLPLVATTFTEPAVMSPQDFVNRWKALEGNDSQQQVVLRAPGGPASVDLAAVRALLSEKLHLSLVEGVPGCNEYSLCCGGTFRTETTQANGNKISVGLLLRCEVNPAAGMYRLTVRALHKTISLALKNIATNQLA